MIRRLRTDISKKRGAPLPLRANLGASGLFRRATDAPAETRISAAIGVMNRPEAIARAYQT